MITLANHIWSPIGLMPLLAQGRGGGGGLLNSNTLWLVLLFGALIVALAFFAIFARYFRLWIQSVTTGAGIGIFDLLRMTFRKVNPTVIMRSKIMAVQAGHLRERRASPPRRSRPITWPAATCRW